MKTGLIKALVHKWNGLIDLKGTTPKRPSDSRDRNERLNSATATVTPEFIWILHGPACHHLRIFCWKQFKAWKHRSKRNCVELCVNLAISWVITWDIYSNKYIYIYFFKIICIHFYTSFNRSAAFHNMRNVWTETYKFIKQHPPYRNAQTPTAPEQCSQPLLHSILPIADCTGFYTGFVLVPKYDWVICRPAFSTS